MIFILFYFIAGVRMGARK